MLQPRLAWWALFLAGCPGDLPDLWVSSPCRLAVRQKQGAALLGS